LFIYFYFLNLYFVLGISWSQKRTFRIWKKFLNDDDSSVMTNLGMQTEGWDQQKGGTGLLLILTLFNRLLLIYNTGNPRIESLRFLRDTHPGTDFSYPNRIFDNYSLVHRPYEPFRCDILYHHLLKSSENIKQILHDSRAPQKCQKMCENFRELKCSVI